MILKAQTLKIRNIVLKLDDEEGNTISFKPIKKEDGTYELIGIKDIELEQKNNVPNE